MSRALWVVLVGAMASGCSLFRATRGDDVRELRFEPVVVTGDPELDKLNDEELFAAGTSAFAAEDFKQAARFFGRLADVYLDSKHRRAALYNAGLANEKLDRWEEAHGRFLELADPKHGTGDALDASFRVAETLYHLERFDDAVAVLKVIAQRKDVTFNQQIEAMVQQGVCELEAGRSEEAEKTLRHAVAVWQDHPEKDLVEEYFPAQAQFFMGEIYRLHYESMALDPDKGTDQLSKDLEYKAELLLSAQGHYLRSIRIGNGYWATASGAQIGSLYEGLYRYMVDLKAPKELNDEEAEVYKVEVRKKIRVLITKAITIYERTLEAAERIGANNPFVERTRESLRKMKELLLAEAKLDEDEPEKAPPPPPAAKTHGKKAIGKRKGPRT